MNIEAYDADSLRKIVRKLEYENKLLKEQLKKAGIPYDKSSPFEEKIENTEEYDPDQGNRIVIPARITESMAIHFFQCFGEEKMYMPGEVRTADIILNVIIGGMIIYVRNNTVRGYTVMSARIKSGQDWMLKR